METLEEEDCLSQDERGWDQELDISQLCRICANPNEYLIPIFCGEGIEHELDKKIIKHLPIKVTEHDKLPTNLCYQCASTLIAWHDMVVGCLEADEKLKCLIQDQKDDEASVMDEDVEKKRMNEYEEQVITDATICAKIETVEIPQNLEDMTVITEVKDPDASVENELVIEEVASKKPEFIEEITSDTRDVIVFKTEDETDEVVQSIEPKEEDAVNAVEVYEDVETSIVVHDLVEDFEEGQYIAFIGDEFIESSVEIVNPKIEEVTESAEDSNAFVCEDCGKVFMNIREFQVHLSTHQVKGHICSYCDANYKRIDHLHKHIEIMHPNSNIALAPKEKKINPYAKTFLCNTCGKILKSSIAYENHTLKHQSKCPYPCSICSETFPNRGARRRHEVKEHNLLTKDNGNPDGYHVCEICGLEMFSDGAYYHHKDKHGDPYPCGFCGKLYGSRSLMQVHARRHTTERPFVCTICNRNFKVKQELNAHLNIHKDLRPYQCPHCPKMCRKSSDLTHHVRTHTGEKPYICDKCGRGFAQAGDMRKHRQLHFRPSKINKTLQAF